jgi:hypothetical protein
MSVAFRISAPNAPENGLKNEELTTTRIAFFESSRALTQWARFEASTAEDSFPVTKLQLSACQRTSLGKGLKRRPFH